MKLDWPRTVDATTPDEASASDLRRCLLRAAASFCLVAAGPANASEGCKVLLCLAAPDWRSIPECVDPVRQAMRDVARGKPFPKCEMAGGDTAATHSWLPSLSQCPPQYLRPVHTERGIDKRCEYMGSYTVVISGQPWTRAWWAPDGGTVTEFSPAAKAALGTWDTRFEDDHASWLAAGGCLGCGRP